MSSQEAIAATRAVVERDDRAERRPERVEPRGAERVVPALRDEIGALPVVAAIEGDEDMVRGGDEARLVAVTGEPRQAHPQHIHRRPEILRRKTGGGADGRVAPVGADGELGADRDRAVGRRRLDADDFVALDDEAGRLVLHEEAEARIAGGPGSEEIEKVPLRHQRDVFADRRQVREIDGEVGVAEGQRQPVRLLVGEGQEIGEEAELVHQFEGRGVDGVAAEIAEEVGVLLEHDDIDPGAGEEKAEHHPRRSAAGDAAGRLDRSRHRLFSFGPARKRQYRARREGISSALPSPWVSGDGGKRRGVLGVSKPKNGGGDADGGAAPFWRTKSLAEMSAKEWESLCDGCGRCCLNKLEDWDTGEISWTEIACKLLDGETCRCGDYKHRTSRVPDCERLTPENVPRLNWLPPTCGYRLVSEGRDLYWWHPLLSGDPDTVHHAGISVRGRTVSEAGIPVRKYEDYVVEWPGEDPAERIEVAEREVRKRK